MKPDRRFLFAHPAHFIALGGGAGLAPKAPGTWGTLVVVPLFYVLNIAGMTNVVSLAMVAIVLLFAIGIWASSVTSRNLGVADHGGIVIDEIVAFLLVLMLTPNTFAWWIAAFIIFRAFDIVKPWPISVADKHIKGGFGVMFDDLLAAAYSIVVILLLQSML